MNQSTHKTPFSFITTLPGIFIALLPKLVCPACLPMYAGVLSSLGISVSGYSQYYFPLMTVLLLLALWALGFRAKQRHGYYPLILGIFATFIILFAKVIWHSAVILYVGILLLIAASIWNAWPIRKSPMACPACKKST